MFDNVNLHMLQWKFEIRCSHDDDRIKQSAPSQLHSPVNRSNPAETSGTIRQHLCLAVILVWKVVGQHLFFPSNFTAVTGPKVLL